MSSGSLIFPLVLVLLVGCCTRELYSKPEPLQPIPPKQDFVKQTPPGPDIVRTEDYVIVIAQRGDTLRSLAKRFLGDAAKYWIIADFNDLRQLMAGQEIVIPLTPKNPIGVYANGYQTVPILSYHRFGQTPSTLVVTPEAFEAQMAYLKTHDYRVIPLAALLAFIKGQQPLPRRAVVLTFDDGYKSIYTIAYPILKQYGFPATVFVYSDFIGAPDALSWQEMQEMVASRLIDIQPHSKTHSNLGLKDSSEDNTAYAQRIETEIRTPARQIKRRLQLPMHTFAYPYGDTNDVVIDRLKTQHYHMGVTVHRGGNPFFTDPFMLHRTMIFGTYSLEDFENNLEVFREENLY